MTTIAGIHKQAFFCEKTGVLCLPAELVFNFGNIAGVDEQREQNASRRTGAF